MASNVQQEVQAILDDAVKGDNTIPGIVFGAMDRNGNYIAKAAAGTRGRDRPHDKMTTDTAFAIYSCTKMITAIAVMKLVEQGQLKLDEPAEDVLPELGSIKLFDGSSPKNKITLRMLMSHTAGFGYTFFHPEVKAWCESKGGDEFQGKWAMLQSPLLAEPGTDWNYGSNMDWAGKMLEKVSGQTLGEYCRQHIFEPLGCKDISFGLLPQCKDRFASLHQSHPDGKMRQIDHLPFTLNVGDFDSGGAGCIGTLDDYLRILTILINKGKGANGAQVLKPDTVDQMFEDQLAKLPLKDPRAIYKSIAAAKPEYTNATEPELFPGTEKGWGLSALLTTNQWPTGRSPGSLTWAGLVNLFWMADREKGVCEFVMTQHLPFGSPLTINPWLACEGAVYKSLASAA